MLGKPIRNALIAVVVLVAATAFWFTPSPGKVSLVMGDLSVEQPSFPTVSFSPNGNVASGLIVRVQDPIGWAHIKLYLNHRWLQEGPTWQQIPSKNWQWEWQLPLLQTDQPAELVAFHSCDVGCIEWWRRTLQSSNPSFTPAARPPRQPTKLGLVFAMSTRDWHSRAGWNVELTYALADKPDDYWMLDHVAERVMESTKQGLRVLLRVDYDRGQSIPPLDDYEALNAYLKFMHRLAGDARFRDVYGLIIGSGYNDNGSNSKAPNNKVTPEWYARLFSGYGIDVRARDNVIETVRSINTQVRVLVGPVRPFNLDQTGSRIWQTDAPWLNYMNTLVAALDAVAKTKSMNGKPFLAPDGFALQAPGRPDSPGLHADASAHEPNLDLARKEWNGAQAGFRIYQDWLAIINHFESMRGLPAYITSTNTFTPDTKTPPAQNYPKGWLAHALDEINAEPQVHALCWFMDGLPSDEQWDLYSLTKRVGMLTDAADDFDALLRN